MGRNLREVKSNNPRRKGGKKRRVPTRKLSNRIGQSIKFGLILLLSLIAIICSIIVPKVYTPLKKINTDTDIILKNIDEEDFRTTSNSWVYDNEGNELYEIKKDKNVEYLTYNEVPKQVYDAFIAIEDRRFYGHKGVDLKSILRAALAMVKNDGDIRQGGSTITQQLVKIVYLTNEKSFERKLKELTIAKELERRFTKEQILEFYVNNIYFANNAYGINAASLEYFNKPAQALTLSETAFLCAIPNLPQTFNPYNVGEDGTNQSTIKRRNIILNNMLELGTITQEECDLAKSEKINIVGKPDDTIYDNRMDYVIKEVTEILMEKNGFQFRYKFKDDADLTQYKELYEKSYKENKRQLYRGGYKITTSFNEGLQKEVQKIIDKRFQPGNTLNHENIYELQVASAVIENETGLIQALIGGVTSPSTDYINRSFMIERQNGSTMKPILVYGPAMDILGTLPVTSIDDTKEDDGPKNSTGYFGNISVREAIRISSNTVAYKLYRDIKPSRGLDYLYKMKFEDIVPTDNNLSMSIGGMTKGTNVIEMAGAYATIANKGAFNKPTCILEICDAKGKSIYKYKPTNEQIYSELTSIMLTDTMKDVIYKGTGRGGEFSPTIEVAGKTGSTDDVKDWWFAGFSPKYTTTIWTGYDIPKRIATNNPNTKPVNVWKAIMEATHKGMKNLKFEDLSNLTKKVYVNSKGEEVQEGTSGGKWEIFPATQKVPKSADYYKTNKKNEFLNKLKNIMRVINKESNKEELFKAEAELQSLVTEINLSDIDEQDKHYCLQLIEIDQEKVRQYLKSNENDSSSSAPEINNPEDKDKPVKPNKPEDDTKPNKPNDENTEEDKDDDFGFDLN